MPLKIVVDIRRSELHTHRASFWPWEIPILEFIHAGNVKQVGEEHADNRVLDPVNEYERLERRFGFDKETHAIRVHAVYGAPPLGINQLATAMQKHLEEQAELDATAAEAADAAAALAEGEGAPPVDHLKERDAAGEHVESRSRRRASS